MTSSTCATDCDGCAAYLRLFADLSDLSPCEPAHVRNIRPLVMAAFHGDGDERAWLEIVAAIAAIVRAAGPRATPSPALRRVEGILEENLDLVPSVRRPHMSSHSAGSARPRRKRC